MDFYKIKEGMTKQHKELLLELKKTYEGSIADYKRQEDDAKVRLQPILDELNNTVKELSMAKKELSIVSAETEKLRGEREQFIAEREQLKNDRRILDEERIRLAKDTDDTKKKMADDERVINIRLTARLDQVNQAKKDAEYSEVKNKDILGEIYNARQSVEARIQKYESDCLDLREKQYQFQEDMKKHLDEIKDTKAKISKVEQLRKEVSDRAIVLNKRSEALDSKEKEYAEKLLAQGDRDIALDLREAEIQKTERRVNNLIEIHNLK